MAAIRLRSPTPSQLPQGELEGRLLYSVVVAGKNAEFADAKMAQLWRFTHKNETPLVAIKRMIDHGTLDLVLRTCGTGNYTKIHRCFREIIEAKLDLRTCTPDDLEKIHGIGPKTSRFFILWTRPDARYAALDVHILRWLGTLGHKVPRSTPQAKKTYKRLEMAFLKEADSRGMTPRELDYKIWCEGAGYNDGMQENCGLGEVVKREKAA